MLVFHELLWAVEGWTWRWGLLVECWEWWKWAWWLAASGDDGCCGLLGEWGHRGPLKVLVCCGLLWSAAEWMLGWDPKWIWLGLDGVVGPDQWLMVVG